MKSWKLLPLLALGGIATGSAWAQAPAGAPADSTGLCKDGSYTSHATKKGACAGHKGVKTWYESADSAPSAPALAAAAKPIAAAKPAAATPGEVWVNSATKVYHCPGTKWYGKSKQGEYMSESAAKAAGNHADHGKSCS
jgi:hypothetical protein